MYLFFVLVFKQHIAQPHQLWATPTLHYHVTSGCMGIGNDTGVGYSTHGHKIHTKTAT